MRCIRQLSWSSRHLVSVPRLHTVAKAMKLSEGIALETGARQSRQVTRCHLLPA